MNDDHAFDDHLLGRIDDAFDHDLPPVPARLSSAARDAFAWRRVDAELAELLFDSAADELVGIRGTSIDRRSFRYAAGDSVIRVHLSDASLIVMLEPPLSVSCRIASGDDVAEHRTDDLGELAVDAPDLPMRLEFDLPSGRYITPWITG